MSPSILIAETGAGESLILARSRLGLWCVLAACLGFAPTTFAFTNTFFSLPGCRFSSVTWGDYDGDGRLDLLLTGESFIQNSGITELWRNHGDGFTKIEANLPGVYNGCATWGDYDNDGRLDILLAGTTVSGQIAQLWRNTGTGFSRIETSFPGLSDCAAAWGDFDNDGRPDLLLCGYREGGLPGPVTDLWRNTGAGFVKVATGLPQLYESSVAWGDYDKDGRTDLLLCGQTETNSVTEVWRNTGSGFVNMNVGLPGVAEGSVAWGDYDNDGQLDILLTGCAGFDSLAEVWRNTGNGFTNLNAPLPGVRWGQASWGDYDNDGRADALLHGWNGTRPILQLFRNHTTGFVEAESISPGIYYGASAWGDWNRDGRLDFVMAGYAGSGASNIFTQILGNATARSNTPPWIPNLLTSKVEQNGVRLSWMPGSDAETPWAGLTYNVRVGTRPDSGNVLSPQSLPTGIRLLAQGGNVQSRLFCDLTNLASGVYYWTVQSLDPSFAASRFAAEQTFLIGGPRLTITNLALSTVVLRGYGSAGTIYALEGSTNLTTWSALTTLPADANGMVSFTNTTTGRYQFYRLSR